MVVSSQILNRDVDASRLAPDTGHTGGDWRREKRSWAGILLGAAPITSLESHSGPGWLRLSLSPDSATKSPLLSAMPVSLGTFLKGNYTHNTPLNWHPLIIERHDLQQ